MVTSYFRVCKLWVLPLKTDIWWNVKTHWLIIVLTEPKNMLIHYAVFHSKLFSWLYFLQFMRHFQLCWFWTRTAYSRGWPLARHQLNGSILLVMSIFQFKSFIPSIFNFLFVVQTHLAQTCSSITRADLQTFYQMSVFSGKTHNLRTQKYDVSMMSLVAMNIWSSLVWNACFLLNVPWKFSWKCKHFHDVYH